MGGVEVYMSVMARTHVCDGMRRRLTNILWDALVESGYEEYGSYFCFVWMGMGKPMLG